MTRRRFASLLRFRRDRQSTQQYQEATVALRCTINRTRRTNR